VLLPPEEFFTRSWAGRGRDYRMLVEPLDIANWYIQVCGRCTRQARAAMPRRNDVCGSLLPPGPWLQGRHACMQSRTRGQTPTQTQGKNADVWGHYADGITNESVDDNGKRPGRYIKLQVWGKGGTGQGRAALLGWGEFCKCLSVWAVALECLWVSLETLHHLAAPTRPNARVPGRAAGPIDTKRTNHPPRHEPPTGHRGARVWVLRVVARRGAQAEGALWRPALDCRCRACTFAAVTAARGAW
jgi:hypothetical protein